jgi:TonB family protein
MKMPAKTVILLAGLAPAAAWAHCCCEHHHHAVRHHRTYHRMVRAEDWDLARFEVTAGRPCGNYPVSALRARASGVTWVKLRVDRDGFVRASRIAGSSGRADLDRAALACVTGWHLGTGYEWRSARIVWRFHRASWYG